MVRLLSPSEGGNPKPIYSNYRPLLRYVDDPPDRYHDVTVEPDPPCVEAGQSAKCKIVPFAPEFHIGQAVKGARFELLDGLNVRATGVIIRSEGFLD